MTYIVKDLIFNSFWSEYTDSFIEGIINATQYKHKSDAIAIAIRYGNMTTIITIY